MKTLFFILMILPCVVYSYEVGTHMTISEEAVVESILDNNTESVLTNLGLENDLRDLNIQSFPDSTGEPRSIIGLIRHGADFEDSQSLMRPLNHFFDPKNNRGLTIGIETGYTSPDWALEDNGDVSHQFAGDQEYSYKEAMNYFYHALTDQTEEMISQNWGLLFQSLGQVIHHIQDMAQPDHVRNDQHLPIAGVDPSWYEEYSNNRFLTGINDITLNYDIPVFSTAREFWSTRDSDVNIADRRGIADFTNRNFVSKDTMFTILNGSFAAGSEYELPEPLPASNMEDVSNLIFDSGISGSVLCDQLKASNPAIIFPSTGCNIEFVQTTVFDSYAGVSSTNDKAATYSIFDKKLQQYGQVSDVSYWSGAGAQVNRLFTLNEFNFKAAHDYLIPRAVAYSAGLINHFFRGKIDMIPNPTGDGWLIQNLSSEEMEGTFKLYCDDVNGNRNEVTNGIINTVMPLVSGGNLSFTGIDLSECNTYLILVFKGRIGSEGSPYDMDNYVVTGKYINLHKNIVLLALAYQHEGRPDLSGVRGIMTITNGFSLRLWDYDKSIWLEPKTSIYNSNITVDYMNDTVTFEPRHVFEIINGDNSSIVQIHRINGTIGFEESEFSGLHVSGHLINQQLDIYENNGLSVSKNIATYEFSKVDGSGGTFQYSADGLYPWRPYTYAYSGLDFILYNRPYTDNQHYLTEIPLGFYNKYMSSYLSTNVLARTCNSIDHDTCQYQLDNGIIPNSSVNDLIELYNIYYQSN